MDTRNAHGGAYVPPRSQSGGSVRAETPTVYGAPRARVRGSDYSLPANHGGGFVPPQQQSPRDKKLSETREATSQADDKYIAVGLGDDPGSGKTPAYQQQAYQAPTYQAQVYQSQNYQSQSYQAEPYQTQPYQAQPHQAQPYQAQPYQSPPYNHQPYQSQTSYPSSSYKEGSISYTEGASSRTDLNPQSHDASIAQPNMPPPKTVPTGHARDTAVAFLGLAEAKGITDTVPGFNQDHRTVQKGSSNDRHPLASKRFKYPKTFQMPQLLFRATDTRRHRDIMQRVYEGLEDDRYISPWDGHLAKLFVQASQEVYDGAANATWRRTYVRNVSPRSIRIANWPIATCPTRSESWTKNDWVTVCIKWLPACGGLLCVLLFDANGAEGQLRNGGYYDPFLYKHWGYPKTARNLLENEPSSSKHQDVPAANRVLGPRYLCVLNEGSKGVNVIRTDNSTADIEYIFIAYSTKQFDNNSNEDMTDLHYLAELAAREAGVPAFWVAGSCMPEKEEMEQDVYRISDVMRGAHSLVIVVGPEPSPSKSQSREELLKSWGTRMWTLPEALLSPSDKKIKVYTRGHDGPPWEIAKKNFAAVAWNDLLISRQLVDHYGKNLDLSRLELVTIALKCLSNRKRGEYFDGDLSYALMGLLRQRPTVDSSDSAFLAFARLSMANDSDMLLERLICTLPKDHKASWLSMNDAWDSKLWDIYPSCQVAGIGPGDTVILDGAFAAAIRWKAFAPVFYIKQDTLRRKAVRIVLHYSPAYFLLGIILSLVGGLKSLGVFLVVIGLLVILVSPWLTRIVYGGKFWGTQAWFQGFEGYMDLATIESHIFGAYMGRLKWSTAGSPLSCHQVNNFGECVGLDPTMREDVRELVNNANNGGHDAMKVFTLVDTYTMTVTMFAAVRPPVAVVLCGREGGMQRAIMCSYDWATQTLYRETVLRMETPVLEKMFRLNRFRFGLERPLSEVNRR